LETAKRGGEAATGFSSALRGADVVFIRHPENLQRFKFRVDDSKFRDVVVLIGLALDHLFDSEGRLSERISMTIERHAVKTNRRSGWSTAK